MSEPQQKSGGGALAGAVSALALSAVGFVTVSVAVPVPKPADPTVVSVPEVTSVDPPEVLDITTALTAPGQETVAEEASLDLDPALPEDDRDTPVQIVEDSVVPVDPLTSSEDVEAPDVDLALPDVPSSDDAGSATVSLPELDPVMSAPDAAAPDLTLSTDPTLGTPDIGDQEALPAPPAATAAVATFQPREEVVVPDDAAKPDDPVVDNAPPQAVAAIAAPEPSDAITPAEDVAITSPGIDAAASPAQDGPARPDESAPEDIPDTQLAAISAPRADNPVARKPDPQVAQPAPAPAQDGPAFDIYADQEFVPDPDKPLLAIIIQDIGADGVPARSLIDLAIPVTIGLQRGNASVSDYQARGFELVAQLSTADGSPVTSDAAPSEIQDAVAGLREELGTTVAFGEPVDGNLYRNAKLMAALGESLAQSGHGMVVFERFGAGAAVSAVRAEGVRTGSILRVLDETRDAAAIRRALDRAALEASKTGATIVYARSYPETLAALLPWLLSNTARSIQIAPLTATMSRLDGG